MSKPFKVRDRRNKGWFYVDNEYINGLGKYLGPVATSIYMSLCRHADADQKCFPSQELMAEELGVSVRTVIRHLDNLKKHNVIVVHREYTGRKWDKNEYTLLDKSEWIYPNKIPHDNLSHGTDHVTETTEPHDRNDTNHVTQSHTKDTNRRRLIKKTNSGDKKSPRAKTIRFEPIDKELADLLFKRIEKNNPTTRKPNIEKWSVEIRKMREIDHRTVDQIKFIINWSQRNNFWQANILSTEKLREKFDTLVAQVRRDAGKEQIKKDDLIIA